MRRSLLLLAGLISLATASAADYTYYMVAPDGWNESNTCAYFYSPEPWSWNDKGTHHVTVSEKKAKVGNDIKPVLCYTISQKYGNFIFVNGTDQREHKNIEPGVIYSANNEDNTTYSEVNPDDIATIYFNSVGWPIDTPKVHILNSSNNQVEEGTMTQVNADEPNIWMYSSNQLKSSDYSVNFTMRRTDNNTDVTLVSANANGFDRSHWADYIYSVGVNVAPQSYITYAEYRALKDATKTRVFINGDENLTSVADNGAETVLNWDPANGIICDTDDGVAYFHFRRTEKNSKKGNFKITWINVADILARRGVDPADAPNLRVWATYNVGILGGENYTIAGSGDTNAYSLFEQNVCQKYNNRSGADWRVDGKFNNGDYYIVIDSHKECKTLTLLDFNPNPDIEFGDLQLSRVEIGYDNALALNADGRYQYSSKVRPNNGRLLFDEVNKVSAQLTVDTESQRAVKDGLFTVSYRFFENATDLDPKPLFIYDGVPSSLYVDYMPLSGNLTLYTRALYTDNNNRTFHSKRAEAPMGEFAVKFVDPDLHYEGGEIFHQDNADPTVHQFTTTLNMLYDHDHSNQDVVCAMDYEVNYPGLDDNAHTLRINGANWTNIFPEDGTSDYSLDYAWNRKIMDAEGRFTLYAPNSICVDDPKNLANDAEATITVTGKAVYPFLVRTEGPIVTTSAAANAPQRRAAEKITDVDAYTVVAGVRTATQTINFANEVTAIETVGTDNMEMPARYYNMQGIEVAAPQPGQIYIVRRGNTATKQLWK